MQFYPEHGVASILERYDELSRIHDFEVRLNTRINDIYVDFSSSTIHLTDASGNNLSTKKLIIGFGIDLDVLRSDRYNMAINVGRVTDVFTFVLIALTCDAPLDFSYVDFSLQKTNRLIPTDLARIDFERLSTNRKKGGHSLLWRVTHITPYSTLSETGDTKLLCIDTDGWLPKSSSEETMVLRLLEYLGEEGLLPAGIKLKEYAWKRKVVHVNKGLGVTLKRYFGDLIETTVTNVLADNPRVE